METLPHANDEDMTRIRRIVKDAKVGVLTTVSPDGDLHSRPLAAQDVEFDGDLWFFVRDDSPKVRDIAAHPQVNVAFEGGGGWLSIAGAAELVHDRERVDQLWSPAVEAWFPDGRDDPALALLRVEAESAEYWATDAPGIVSAFKIVKAMVTHSEPDVGDNRTVEL
ncbi:pyridoxamine 5'-phosphate oxidase family protein [Microbacterium stercoris]|uniref:Pyridoxamine 5'-phosphate oxidase family protein n=1 Tax=Microbacterium stercoris TaxID=2820289 RepID=A0A939QKY9_9MICO|nr:pyridoxamine 5'-phosphate oxidase family protein [Microbacterium stercoris]MBO3664822.1 pyridoxamine 5'-phosphate oxidase family protein [Microbacterium stercoris]